MNKEQIIAWAESTLLSYGIYDYDKKDTDGMIERAKQVENACNKALEEGRKKGFSDYQILVMFGNQLHDYYGK